MPTVSENSTSGLTIFLQLVIGNAGRQYGGTSKGFFFFFTLNMVHLVMPGPLHHALSS